MQVRPKDKYRNEPEKPTQGVVTGVDVAEQSKRPTEKKDRCQVRARMEVVGTGQKGQGRDQGGQRRVDPHPDESVRDPGEEPGQEGSGGEQDRVQTAGPVEQRKN